MGPDDRVCLCFRITRRKLEKFVRFNHPRVASQLAECGGAGTGCGWCIPFIRQIFEAASSDGRLELEVISVEEYELRRAVHIAEGKGKPPSV